MSALVSPRGRAAGAREDSAALAARLLEPIRELPSTTDLLADALRAKPLCPIPVSQFVLDSLSATGRPELTAAFTLSDDSCALIANAFTYNMSPTLGKVSSLHRCATAVQACSLQACLVAATSCSSCLASTASLQNP